MSTTLSLEAAERQVRGRGASRRLRKADLVPAILYGHDLAPISLQIVHKDLLRASEKKEFYAHLVDLKVGRKTHKVMVKDLQRHAYKNKLLHVDFQAIGKNEVVTFELPLTFINADVAPGVKLGGQLTISKKTLTVRCKAKDIPDNVEVDLGELVINQILHVSDIKLPKGVESYDLILGADHDLAIASIYKAGGNTDSEEQEDQASSPATEEKSS